ncbi:MAG: hypothetical protein K1X85_12585 [Ignavibacteria bacterium]|nr:hypothetical protein [Ignavibacteria bacterium]
MRTKFLIYALPLLMACFVVYGFSVVDDPRNDSPNSTSSSSLIFDGKISQRGNPVTQYDTIPQAGFPYPKIFNWDYSAIAFANSGTVGGIQFNSKWILNKWNTTNGALFYRWNNNGPGGGPGTIADSQAYVGAIRDLTVAPDGSGTQYLWGGAASTTLYKMTQTGQLVASYVHTGAAYRAIAWDPNRKGFWSANFTGNIVCRDTLGTVLATVVNATTDSIAGKYGLGFDSTSTPGTAYLWVWNQGTRPSITNANPNGGDEIIRINLTAGGVIQGRWVIYRPAASLYIAGGAEVQTINTGSGTTLALICNHQNGAVVAYDLLNPIPLPANDVGAASIGRPAVIEGQGSVFNPTAQVTNYGSNTQTFNVTMTINPGGYTSTKTVTSLTSLSTTTVTFDPYTASSTGSFTAKAYSQLGTDTNPNNDTTTKSFSVQNFNYGTSGGFSFSNSFPGSGAPSQPDYCWKDTAGSTSLCVNSINANAGIFTGSLDDGYWALRLPAGKQIRLGGVAYDSFFVGTNGVVGFVRQAGLTSFSPAFNSTNRPALYSLWQDMNLSVNANYPVNRVSYKINGYQLIITYNRIPEFSPVGTGDYITYQVVIDLTDPGYAADSRFLVQYNYDETGSDYRSFYTSDGLNAHIIGIQSASGGVNTYYRGAYPVSPAGIMFNGTSSIAVQFGPNANRLNASCDATSLTLTASLEAITPDAPPSSNSSDTITVLLRSATAPYEIVDAASGVLDASGNASLNFFKVNLGSSYYIVVKHRNSIETWSANPVSFTADASYDFTSSAGQAYGSNQVIVGGDACLYGGDVNQDGFVDASDGSNVDNDAFNFVSGYVSTDVNNDGFVDATDGSYVENNAFNFVGVIRP